MSLEALYQQIILDHSRARNGSGLPPQDTHDTTGESHQLNPVCGDEITVRVTVQDKAVQSLRWQGTGCAISMASASMLHELATTLSATDLQARVDAFRQMLRSRGTTPGDPELLGDAASLEGVSRYPARVKCAMLAWVAAEGALEQITPAHGHR